MSNETIKVFQDGMLEKLQDKIKELNLFDKETYTQAEFKAATALINAFTTLESLHRQYQGAIAFAEEVLENV
jgi:hypothetical protein